ncbi:11117_t:CDS:2, partial [Racocetra fulgida]
YCSVYLVAIPSHEEGGTTSTWTNRATYSADIYIKHPETFVEIKKATLDTTKFSAIKPLREFDKTEFGTPDEKPRFPGNGKPFPDDLVTAWADQLNKPEHADVEFRVQGQSIYANTTILTRRSEYFQRMFEGRWMESITYNQSEEDQVTNTQPPPQQQVPTPEDEDTDMDSNILGGNSTFSHKRRRYDELRDHVMSYVVQNFQNVCKTSGFKNITLNSDSDYSDY